MLFVFQADIDAQVNILLGLKKDFKSLTGRDWKPDAAPAATTTPVTTTAPQKATPTMSAVSLVTFFVSAILTGSANSYWAIRTLRYPLLVSVPVFEYVLAPVSGYVFGYRYACRYVSSTGTDIRGGCE